MLSFGMIQDQHLVSNADAFHMWVCTHEYVIDFMEPIHSEAAAEQEASRPIPRKMFQKKMSDEARLLSEVAHTGDFIAHPDPELTMELVDENLENLTISNILHVAVT